MMLPDKHLKNAYLTGYRTISFVMLASIMVALICYAVVIVFFTFSRTWLAPTVLSYTSDKMLQFENGYEMANAAQNAARTAYDAALRQLEVLKTARKELTEQLLAFGSASDVESRINGQQVHEGELLAAVKRADIAGNASLANALAALKKQTEESLAAHLITQDAAVETFTLIQTFNNTATDARVSLLTLNEAIDMLARNSATLQGTPQAVDKLAHLKGAADTAQALVQNAADIANANETVAMTKKQLQIANDALAALKASAYMSAHTKGADLAFVPYMNKSIAYVGAGVYDCHLMIVACHKVGTIKYIYHDEQLVDFPVFNVRLVRTVRGFFVGMNMSDEAAMNSDVLFVGKPLLL